MKVVLVTALLLCALVVFVKASPFAGLEEEQDENLEHELYELAGWDVEDPAMVPTKPSNILRQLRVDAEELLKCFLEEGKGRMRRECIKRFKEHLPPQIPDKMRLLKCVIDSFKQCAKEPEGHKPIKCMEDFRDCLPQNLEGGEGSGN